MLKFAPLYSNAGVTLQTGSSANVICQSGMYRPIILTATDDRSVGVDIPVSAPSNLSTTFYANPALGFDASSSVQGMALRCFQVRYAKVGMSFKANGSSGNGHSLWHAQFASCDVPIHVDNSTKLALRNALFYSSSTRVFDLGASAVLDAQFITVDQATTVVAGGTLNLTNSILSSYTTLVSGAAYNSGFVSDNMHGYGFWYPPYAFGKHYLFPGTLQSAGTPPSDPTLLADIKQRTTQPASNMDSSTSTLPTAVVRDIWGTNLGYHYDPVDAQADTVNPTSALNYVIPAGYVISLVNSGIEMDSGSIATTATPGSRAWLLRDELVEEWPDPSLTGENVNSIVYGNVSYDSATVFNLNYCNFSVFAGAKTIQIGPAVASFGLTNCEFYAGSIVDTNGPDGYGGATFRTDLLRNNLFVRTKVTMLSAPSVTLTVNGRNNTFAGSTIALSPPASDSWTFRNNLFEHCAITPGPFECLASNNAYVTNSSTTTTLNASGSTDQFMNSLSYNKGTLGYYYVDQSSSLIDNGDGMADTEGFFFYTTSSTQALEGQSRIDIGYHYVALDGSGLPFSSGGGPGVVNDPNGSAYLNANAYAGGNGPSQGFNVVITKPVNGQNHP